MLENHRKMVNLRRYGHDVNFMNNSAIQILHITIRAVNFFKVMQYILVITNLVITTYWLLRRNEKFVWSQLLYNT